VLNRADSKVGLDSTDVERVMKVEVDTMIPSSRLVPTALNKGRPVVLDEPGSDVSTAVRHLATKLTQQFGAEETGGADAGGNGKGKKRKLFSKA
jgi:MinD-like ATPase involved in chromosome partitioning or flagellar assembly